MDPDKLALLKVTAVVAVIVAFLVIWFLTVGAPAAEEEEETTESAVDGNVLVLGAPFCEAPETAATPYARTVGTPFPSPALS